MIDSSRVIPSSWASRTVSVRNGSELRLPKSTGRVSPRRCSSSWSAATRARFWSLMGLLPPKWW
ncbi:hypothetical protein BJF81_09905 [Ornithinimicrobium sp. CNJ-824]|nr:hypothetical protein BJF81_09905 [Ornithinimicrobium sp. CNJ-824]